MVLFSLEIITIHCYKSLNERILQNARTENRPITLPLNFAYSISDYYGKDLNRRKLALFQF